MCLHTYPLPSERDFYTAGESIAIYRACDELADSQLGDAPLVTVGDSGEVNEIRLKWHRQMTDQYREQAEEVFFPYYQKGLEFSVVISGIEFFQHLNPLLSDWENIGLQSRSHFYFSLMAYFDLLDKLQSKDAAGELSLIKITKNSCKL